jgi:hypothetical protein
VKRSKNLPVGIEKRVFLFSWLLSLSNCNKFIKNIRKSIVYLKKFLLLGFIKKQPIMKTIKYFLISLMVFATILSQTVAQLEVNYNVTPEEMVEAFIGPGVSYSNVQFIGANIARGQFSNGNTTNIGVDHGIALTSGMVEYIIGPNMSYSKGFNNGLPGDPWLTICLGNSTYDASVLEFDFVPASDTAWCRYVFGSEEYSEWVGSAFNDIFGFFVNGPKPEGGNYGDENIALVPGTILPVAINSVNNGYAIPGTPTSGPGTNSEYFIDNLNGLTIEYDGFTVPLEAKVAVIPGETYHFKLAIADASDGIFDSGVLLEGESFKSQGTADFLTFGFLAALNPGLPEDLVGLIENDIVKIEIPYGTDLTGLIASFETPGGVIVTMNGEAQQSGITPNDFSQTLNYHLSGRNEKYWQVIVDLTTGMVSRELKNVSIFPNPAVGKFELQNINSIDINVYSLIGTKVIGSVAGKHGNTLLIDNLLPGIYFIELKKDGLTETRKVVVN